MRTLAVVTLFLRIATALVVAWVAADLVRAARQNGPLLRAFAGFVGATAVAMSWHVLAQLVGLAGFPGAQTLLLDVAAVVWLLLLLAALELRRRL